MMPSRTRPIAIAAALAALFLVPAAGSAVLAQGVPSDFVPPDEVLKRLRAYENYLSDKRGNNISAARAAAAVPAVAAAVADLSESDRTAVLGRIHYRVQDLADDFYRANLAPLKASDNNVSTVYPSVLGRDFDALGAAMDRLKEYESTTLQGWRDEETALVAKQASVLAQIVAIQYKVKAMPATAGRDAITEAEAPLPALQQQWDALDAQDAALAHRYVRKVFTFEIPDTYRGGNNASLLVDGAQVYQRIKQLIDDTAKSEGAKGYIHVSLWMCDDTTLLDPSTTFLQALKSAAESGVEVRVKLWDAWKAQDSREFHNTYVANQKCAADLEALRRAKLDVGVGFADLPLSGSMHMKYFIFYNGSEVRAIVGGLNIDKGQYTTAQHAKTNGGWTDVHDVAVELSGPAVRDVEEDFSARWPLTGSTVTFRGPTAQFPIAGTEEVDIRFTAPTGRAATVQRSIGPQLLRRVAAAQQYIYLENYAIFDEYLISAIGRRVDQTHREGKTLPVIILLRFDPRKTTDVYNFLHYMTYMHLSFMGCDGFTYTDHDGFARAVDRKTQGRNRWSVEVAGGLYEDTIVHWDDGEVPLRAVTAFDKDTPLYSLVYLSPGTPPTTLPVWVHSKVSIFDDQYTGIGSANFNPRSLCMVGEVTAFIRGQTAAKLRETLWDEYWPTPGMTPEAWRAAAEANLAKLASLAPGRTYVVPVTMGDFKPELFLKIRNDWSLIDKLFRTAHNY